LLTVFIYHHSGEDDLTSEHDLAFRDHVLSDGRIDVNRASVRPFVAPKDATRDAIRNATKDKSAAAAPRTAPRSKLVLPITPLLGGGILLLAAGGALLALSYLHPFSFSLSRPRPVADMRSGSIILASPDPRACRHLSFDNITGAIKDAGTGQCAATLPGAAERLGEVSDSFAHGR
jgi:hypothetical protein